MPKPPPKPSTWFLQFATFGIFVVGGLLAFDGLGTDPEGSAIRQNVLAIYTGSGLILMAIGTVLIGIITLIHKP